MKKKQVAFLLAMEQEEARGIYEEACKQVVKKLEELNEQVSSQKGWVFVNDISYRVKEPMSCLNKMLDKGHSLKLETAKEKLNDIAGVRAVCYFLDDVYQLANLLMECPDYEFIKLKDYVKKPKASGYQSLHVIVRVPVSGPEGEEKVKVEIQLRTRAMDFWSDIEHHFIYKTKNIEYAELYAYEEEFLKCSKSIQKIDKQMLKIRKKIESRNKKQ